MANLRNRIEEWFESSARVLYRNKFKAVIMMLLIIASIVSQISKLTVDVSTEGFMHENDPARISYNAFREQFGRDELILVAIDSQNVFDRDFLGKLKALHNELRENVPFVEDITSLVNARNTRGEGDELIVEDLLEDWPETDEEIALLKERVFDNPMYKNLLISGDGKITNIVIKTQTYSPIGSDDDVLEGFEGDFKGDSTYMDESDKRPFLTEEENSRAVRAAHRIAEKYHTQDFQVYITGSAVVTHFLKRYMLKDMLRFLSLVFAAVIIFLFVMFRRISGVLLPIMIVFLSLISTISIMAAFGVPLKMPTQILPSFLLAVSVGYSVHILAIFYYHYSKGNNKEDSIAYSIGHSGLAILMTAATTAGGLFSLSISDVAPVADLGIFAGIGVLLSMLYTIVLLPALLAAVPVVAKRGKIKPEGMLIDRLLAKVGMISTGNPIAVLLVSFALIAISIVGITKIRFSHDVLRWFPKNNSIRIATEKIDRELRGTVNLEVIVDTGRENGLYDPHLLNRLDETAAYLETFVADSVFVGKAWSIATILKETNRALNENRKEFYSIPQDRRLIAQEFLLFENSGSDDIEDFTDSQFSNARLTIKVPFVDAISYIEFIDVLDEYLQKNYSDVKVAITGMGVLFFRTITNAIASMTKSYIYALVVITILMILLIGHLRIGLLSMIPNLTPIIITLGVMGWFDIPMSLFTMLVANIAIGLAVDDTIHFMHNFRRYFEESRDAQYAAMETLHTTGRAMLVTSCVLSIGFFVFLFAQMNNIIHFGLLTGLTIVMALLADFFISPSLLMILNKQKKSLGL